MSPSVALVLTVAVEAPLYALALVALGLARPVRAALVGVAVNVLTHPVLWYSLAPRPSVTRLLVAELLVCLVEAGLLWLVIRRDVAVLLLVSVGTNATSVLAGLIIQSG